jgi:hypothetical protein
MLSMSELFVNHHYERVRSCVGPITCWHIVIPHPPCQHLLSLLSPTSSTGMRCCVHIMRVRCPTTYHAFLIQTQPFVIERTMMMMMMCYITINAFEYYVYLLNCYAFYVYVANVEKTIEVGWYFFVQRYSFYSHNWKHWHAKKIVTLQGSSHEQLQCTT